MAARSKPKAASAGGSASRSKRQAAPAVDVQKAPPGPKGPKGPKSTAQATGKSAAVAGKAQPAAAEQPLETQVAALRGKLAAQGAQLGRLYRLVSRLGEVIAAMPLTGQAGELRDRMQRELQAAAIEDGGD